MSENGDYSQSISSIVISKNLEIVSINVVKGTKQEIKAAFEEHLVVPANMKLVDVEVIEIRWHMDHESRADPLYDNDDAKCDSYLLAIYSCCCIPCVIGLARWFNNKRAEPSRQKATHKVMLRFTIEPSSIRSSSNKSKGAGGGGGSSSSKSTSPVSSKAF